MSVEWVSSDSKYEISSKNHLLQLMSNGTLFSDTGTPPSNYWSSDYIQVTDIDLESDANIQPIGDSLVPFSGSYDGDNFSITDWSHESLTGDNVGLFGYTSNSTIRNLNMEGSWTLSGVNHCGFLVGNSNSSGIYNITGDFSAGSVSSTAHNTGGLVGAAFGSTIEGLTVKGVLSSITGINNVGGVIGSVNECTVNYVRNMARFSGSPAISGDSCSGVCSKALNSDASYIMNAMVGDVSGTDDAGGLFSTIENESSNTMNHLANSMTGDISSTGSSGGISSQIIGVDGVFNIHTISNYMCGSITATSEAGGIAGSIAGNGVNGSVTIHNSVNAMKGSVQSVGVQDISGSGSTVETQIITDFGLNYTTSGISLELTALTGSFVTHSGFSDLEYFPFDMNSTYIWQFVFANVAGSTTYSNYTHVVISGMDIAGPIEVHTDLEDALVQYVYFLNLSDNMVVTDPGVPVTYSSGQVTDTNGLVLFPIPPLIITTISPFSVVLTWIEVEGSLKYRVDFGPTQGSNLNRSYLTDGDETTATIHNLDASVQYTFQVYSSSDGSVFILETEITGTVTMPENSTGSYILSRFLVDGKYDFSSFSPDKTAQIAPIIGFLLGQDESVLMKVNGDTRELLVSSVSGGTLDIQDRDEYILPFQPSSGSGQSLTLEGIFEGSLDYNESSDSITIEGVELSSGSSVVIGDIRVTLTSV